LPNATAWGSRVGAGSPSCRWRVSGLRDRSLRRLIGRERDSAECERAAERSLSPSARSSMWIRSGRARLSGAARTRPRRRRERRLRVGAERVPEMRQLSADGVRCARFRAGQAPGRSGVQRPSRRLQRVHYGSGSALCARLRAWDRPCDVFRFVSRVQLDVHGPVAVRSAPVQLRDRSPHRPRFSGGGLLAGDRHGDGPHLSLTFFNAATGHFASGAAELMTSRSVGGLSERAEGDHHRGLGHCGLYAGAAGSVSGRPRRKATPRVGGCGDNGTGGVFDPAIGQLSRA